MNEATEKTIRRGTDNVFEDIGIPNAETHMLKAQLVLCVQTLIEARKLTQTETAEIVGMKQPDVSKMLRGQFRDLSVERIIRILGRLGCDVDIVVKPQGGASAFDPIRVKAAA